MNFDDIRNGLKTDLGEINSFFDGLGRLLAEETYIITFDDQTDHFIRKDDILELLMNCKLVSGVSNHCLDCGHAWESQIPEATCPNCHK